MCERLGGFTGTAPRGGPPLSTDHSEPIPTETATVLFVQGVFRSGTTTLFRTLRQDPHRRCFYEPLHPNLLDHVNEASTGTPSHSKSPLYAEFVPLSEQLEAHYNSSLATRHAVLDRNDTAPELKAYLQLLAHSSPRVLLQLNRAFWMTPWLRRQFPESAFVHLVRDPRSVVWSQLTTASGTRVRMKLPLLNRRYFNFSSGNLSNVFSHRAYHGAYHVKEYLKVGRRALAQGPEDSVTKWACEQLREVQDTPPFIQALALWGAQVRVCHHQAQAAFGDQYVLLRYEDLCTHPHRALERIYSLLPGSLPSPVLEYARAHIHKPSLSSWHEVDQAEERLRDGIRRAGIEKVLDEVGYDFSTNIDSP